MYNSAFCKYQTAIIPYIHVYNAHVQNAYMYMYIIHVQHTYAHVQCTCRCTCMLYTIHIHVHIHVLPHVQCTCASTYGIVHFLGVNTSYHSTPLSVCLDTIMNTLYVQECLLRGASLIQTSAPSQEGNRVFRV